VGRREPEAGDDEIDAEIEQLRDRTAKLETVERAAADGDFVVMDYLGTLDGEPFAGGEGRDQMIELGSGRLVPGFEEQLSGAQAGDERTVTITFPDDYGAEDLKGREAQFAVTVKEIKEKQLPPLDDDLAVEAGFDTLDELRSDIRDRLTEQQKSQIEAEFREAALDSVVAGASVDVPDALVEARSQELWDQMAHSLSHQGISKDAYLRISGRTEEQIVADGREDARRSLEREAVLAAIVDAEGIEPPRRRSSRRSSASPGAARTPRRSRGCATAAAWTVSRPISRSARRSTSSRSPRTRSRSIRPRRATSSGLRARSGPRAPRSSGLRAPERPAQSRLTWVWHRSGGPLPIARLAAPAAAIAREKESSARSETKRGP
jgi:trigger factor